MLGDGEKIFNVSSILTHPDHDSSVETSPFDVALLRLSEPANPSPMVGYVCLLVGSTRSFDGDSLRVSGWGTDCEIGKISPVLKSVTVFGLNNTFCKVANEKICETQICAADKNADACVGDGGG